MIKQVRNINKICRAGKHKNIVTNRLYGIKLEIQSLDFVFTEDENTYANVAPNGLPVATQSIYIYPMPL